MRGGPRADLRHVAPSLEEWFGGPVRGEPLAHGDGKSGGRMERLRIGKRRFVLKHLHPADDWVMRATGDLACRPITLWRNGWLDQLPGSVDHAIVGAAWVDRVEGRGGVLVMRDVGEWLVPEGDAEIPLDEHLAFVDHMAQLHAAFWERRDTIGLMPLAGRFSWFGPRLGVAERERGGIDPVPTELVPAGWERFPSRASRAADVVFALLDDPGPLVDALAGTPQTLVHGDWKAGNLGRHADGRTILLDWALTGVGPACAEIAHYLCLNRARLPQDKEATLGSYREALERHGVETEPWWERQCALSLLGMLCLFGWEKALGDTDEAVEELAWWEARAVEGARWL